MNAGKDGPCLAISGFLAAENGLGAAARGICRICQRGGIPISTYVFSRIPLRQEAPFQEVRSGPGAVHLACVPPDAYQLFAHGDAQAFRKAKRNVWYLFWELETVPRKIVANTLLFDEVWAPTQFIAEALRRKVPRLVRHVPGALPQADSKRDDAAMAAQMRLRCGIGKADVVYLFVWDYLSGPSRKNPEAVLRAYCDAFPAPAGTFLLLKSVNADATDASIRRIREVCALRPDVAYLDGYLSGTEMRGLFEAADCYVSLHRSEGLGLTIAASMARGKAVVATAYGGNVDFMSPENSCLIPWRPVPVDDRFYSRFGGQWAEPEHEAAVRAIGELREPCERLRLGVAAQQTITRFSPEALAPVWSQAVKDVLAASPRLLTRPAVKGLQVLGCLDRFRRRLCSFDRGAAA